MKKRINKKVVLGIIITIINIGIWTIIINNNNEVIEALGAREKGIELIDRSKREGYDGDDNSEEVKKFLKQYSKYSKDDVRVDKLVDEFNFIDDYFWGDEITKENVVEKEKKLKEFKTEYIWNRMAAVVYLDFVMSRKKEFGIE